MGKLGSPGKSCASGEPRGRGALRKHACSALWEEPPSGRVSELFALLVRLRGTTLLAHRPKVKRDNGAGQAAESGPETA